MDIRQLKYFVEIVRSGFNLSTASGKLNISQPALSMLIRKFEKEEKIDVFVRQKGLIKGLTTVGETFYNNALHVVAEHERMLEELRHQSSQLNGRLRIGIPPLVLTVVCTEFINALAQKHEHATFKVIESGAHDLERKLLLDEIDCAILLSPTSLSPAQFREVLIDTDELSAFMNEGHPLANKPMLKWEDLQGKSMVMFDDSYMINHKLKHAFETNRVNVHFTLTSKSWDFLLESVRGTQQITVLPAPIKRFYNLQHITEVKFEKPIPWQVIFVYPIKPTYSRIEETMQKEIAAFYLHNHKR